VGKPQLANLSSSTPTAALKDPPIERLNLSIYGLVLWSPQWSASCARLLISVLPSGLQETKIDQHRRLSEETIVELHGGIQPTPRPMRA
jgi:hypothetical protein